MSITVIYKSQAPRFVRNKTEAKQAGQVPSPVAVYVNTKDGQKRVS